jgi:hypothetical protein
MSDTELTELTGPEAERLRALLHRAADSLDVTTPDHLEIEPARRRPNPGRWLGAAAAVLVIAAIGAAWWLSGDDGQRIDTGPAEPSVTVAPRVLEEAGVWRLPEGLDGYRIVGARADDASSVYHADRPGVVEVDDPDEPTRWLSVSAYDELGSVPPDSAEVPLSDEVTAELVPTGGSTWFRLMPNGEPLSELIVSGSALGFDEAELTGLLTEHLGTREALQAAADGTEPMVALLDDAGLGGERLVWEGGDDPGPGSRSRSSELTLVDDDGAEVLVTMVGGDAAPWFYILRFQMIAELTSITLPERSATFTRSVTRRSDLGRNVLESTITADGLDTIRSLAAVTDDGVTLGVTPSYPEAGAPDTLPSLTEEQQLRIINSLRATSEDEFRARLAELGVEFIGADSAGVTTTIEGAPGG